MESESEITTLDAFKLNPHSIYQSGSNQIVCSINLLEFSKYQFESAFIINNMDILKSLCETCNQRNPPRKEQVEGFAYNGLIDSIKISICYENFGKSMLLAKGYLIHLIDKNLFPELAKLQKRKPIFIEDFPGGWIENNKIKTNISDLKNFRKGLSMNTINYSTMLENKPYFQECLYDEEFLPFLKKINLSRNQLHLHNALSFVLDQDSYNSYNQLEDFVKIKFPKIKSQLMKYLEPNPFSSTPSFRIK